MPKPPTEAELRQSPSVQELQDRWRQKHPDKPLPMKLSGKGGGKYKPGDRISAADSARLADAYNRAQARMAAENQLGLNG